MPHNINFNERMNADDRAALKPGDRVWIGDYAIPHISPETVSRLTKTRVITTVGGFDRSYKILDGRRSGSYRYLNAKATPEEIEEWVASQRRESAERQDRERQQQKIVEVGRTLNALVTEPVRVGHEQGGMAWSINNLTEEQVRLCAAALKPQPELPKIPQLTYKTVPATDTRTEYTEYRLGDYIVGLTSVPYLGHCIPWIKGARAKFGIGLKEAKDIWDRRDPAGESPG